MKVLITGFDPFGGESINPALEAVMALPNTISNAEVIKIEIPTVFGKSLEAIKSAIETLLHLLLQGRQRLWPLLAPPGWACGRASLGPLSPSA